MKSEFSRQISRKTQISSLIKIRPVRAQLFHADRQTDMTKLTVAFRNFADAPDNCIPVCDSNNWIHLLTIYFIRLSQAAVT
jgi:hypothetical protein